ncbi:MAG TPA: tetratricopeptide repeat protein [Vicinamibacterales bacterium]|jgi:tetratricopeptide (TPR) repeat protein
MRASMLIAAIATALAPATVHAQDDYAAVLLQYLSGDADAAIERLLTLPYAEIGAGVQAFDETRAPRILTGAAAMHTEAALRRGEELGGQYHLRIATALVEFGDGARGTPNTTVRIQPRHAMPVSVEFRRLWYCTIVNRFEAGAMLPDADRYLARALILFPDNAELQLLAGVAAEMHAAPRISAGSAGDRRRGLEQAEQHYRNVLAQEPDRLEARLRLGRVLVERDRPAEARPLLQPLTTAADDRLAYLAGLFLGGIEERGHHDEEASACYERAAARLPLAQTALLSASELHHRRGDRQWAAEAVSAAAGARNEFDPWWTYLFGEYWRADLLIATVRTKRHA